MLRSCFGKLSLVLALFCYGELVQGQQQIDPKVPDAVADYVQRPDLLMNLWPGTPPGGIPADIGVEKWEPGKETRPIVRVANVAIPTLALYKASKPNGTCVVIFPGGGYNRLAYSHEGTEIASWLNGLGITAVVVKYRIPRRANQAKHMAALQDAQRAVRLVRAHSSAWGIDSARIGVLGFSAGGHLSIMTATQYGSESYSALDEVDKLSSRPDFAIPIYPAYLMDNEKEYKASVPLSSEVVIDSKTPPMFLSVANDDINRGAAAARLYIRMKEANVPCELHIFVKGGHGYGLRKHTGRAACWDAPCEGWLESMGLIPKNTPSE